MAKLTYKKRKGLRSSDFALPKKRKYPVHDRAHAINAKARATQQFKRGNLTEAERKAIFAKANARLGLRGTRARA